MSIIQNENTIGKAFYGNKPIYMFDNGEAKYNEGFEEGKNDVINGSQEIRITKNGIYTTNYAGTSAGGDGEQQITGEYPDGGQFYSYAKVKNAMYDTGIIADLNSRLEFWYKYTGEPNGDAWYEIMGAGNTDDNKVFQIRIYSAWYFHIGGSNKSVYGVTSNEWHHIIVSKADGIVIDGVKKSEFGSLGSYTINAPFYINGIGYSANRMANGEFGMIKINDTIIIPTADGFKNLNTGEILPTVNNGYNGEYTYTGVEVGDIFEIGDLVKKITVDIATEDTNGSYEEGYNDGVVEQKTKLETLTITENGTYTKEDGYNEVVVNVITGGGSEKINLKETGIKLGGSKFSTVPDYFDWTGITDLSRMFDYCRGLTTIPQIDTSLVTDVSYLFYYCQTLKTLPLLDFSNVNNISNAFYNCSSLTNVGGFINLSVGFSLVDALSLTRESVLNIFNNLATVTVNTYIYLHSNVKARLTDDDIAIATSKGWTVS